MGNGYSRTPKLLKGALIRFSAATLIPVPNIIVFQYNPELLSRTLSPWYMPEPTTEDSKAENALAQPFDPKETFSLKLELDATDALEEPEKHPVALVSGVADRISAIEMLLYPTLEKGSLKKAIKSVAAGGGLDVVPRPTIPVVLFFWGPGRIVPVRITSFSVDEKAFSPTLYPIHAEATLGLKVLDASAFDGDPSAEARMAQACYLYTRAQKEALALANVANSAESIMGMLPF